MRHTRVYQLDITYPTGAHTPGWRPHGWDPAVEGPFEWPTGDRMYIAQKSATKRARLLESFGAYVTIHPSNPVTWPSSPTEAAEATTLADQLGVLRAQLARMEREAEHLRVQLEGERARAARYAEQLGLPAYTPS